MNRTNSSYQRLTVKPVLCPYCEGNTKKGRKTLYLYPLTNSFWCARCVKSGSIDNLSFIPSFDIDQTDTPKQLTYNGQGSRYSVVRERNFDGVTDTFQMKRPNGIETGYHERKPNKVSLTHGDRTFGYREAFLDLTKTYRLVEGPYDCVYPYDVCVFGYPTQSQAKLLKPYNLILCPDGDVWTKEENLVRWLKPFLSNNVVGLERLPDDKDPDEVQQQDRISVEWKEAKKWIYQKLKQSLT